MKKFLLLAVAALFAAGAHAEKADSLKQAVINFDTLDVDAVTNTRILTGNVEVQRGTLLLRSDKALVKETPEGYLSVTLTSAPGKVATFRQKRDGGPDLWIEGQAERIEYDERAEMLKLFSRAVIRELDGKRLQNQAESEFISYDGRKEVYITRNDASGESKVGKGRGTLILGPHTPPPAGKP